MQLEQVAKQLFTSNQARYLARSLCLVVVTALPWLAQSFFQLPALAFDNFTDAVFYPSYATNFSDLVLRHGFNYYAMRFGVIFPDALAFWIFGAPDGWLLLRSTIQSLLLLLIFLFFEKRSGWASGLIAVLIWWTSPVGLRLLCTTYLDSISVPLFLAGALLLSWPGARASASFIAGILWGLVASTHLYLLILMPLTLPFILGLRWKEFRGLVNGSLWALCGAMLTWGAAYSYYRGLWGIIDMWAPTKELMGKMAAGDTELWKNPLGEALSTTPAWFAPLLVFVGGAFILPRSTTAFWGAWVCLGASAALFWLGDLVGNAYALSMPFYFSFLFPALFLAAATGVSEILLHSSGPSSAKRLDFRSGKTLVFLSVATLLIGCNSAITRILTPSIAWITVGCLTLLAIVNLFCYLSPSWRKWQYMPFFISFCLSQILILATPFYSQYLGKYKRLHREEIWQPKLAAQLSRILPPASLDGRQIRFWYDDSKPGMIRMVQASQLYSFSMLQDSHGKAASFPEPTRDTVEAIKNSSIEVIMLLDENADRVEIASDSIRSQLENWNPSQQGTLQYRGKKIFYSMLERNLVFEYPKELTVKLSWQPNKPAHLISLGNGQYLLRSSYRKWMFEAESPLPEVSNGGLILFSGQVTKGRFTLSLLDCNDATLTFTELWPTTRPVTRVFPFVGGLGHLRLVLRSMMPDKSHSEIVIFNTVVIPHNDKRE